MLSADPDFSSEVVADLYRYRRKRLSVAAAFAAITGPLGFHRFYLGKTLSGVLMLLTGGGAVIWWLSDLFRLRRMVDAFNKEENAREEAQRPPQGLGFLPPRSELKLREPPQWLDKRRGRMHLVGSLLLLSVIGFSMGVISGATGIYEPVAIILVFVAVTLTAARFPGLWRLPVLRSLSRWNHRLRLYYHVVDPGSVWLLAARPFVGVLFAPWRAQARAEVRLYLQLGVVFALLFVAFDIVEAAESASFWTGFGLLVGEFVQTLIYTYALVGPVGALLTTQLLISERDRVVWVLSVVTLMCLYLGLGVVGAV